MEENFYIRKCTSAIEKKLKWGDSQYWTSYRFKELSSGIQAVSGVSISITTLKRLFGKAKGYSTAQLATKDSLALFLGYNNWQEFTKAVDDGEVDDSKEVDEISKDGQPEKEENKSGQLPRNWLKKGNLNRVSQAILFVVVFFVALGLIQIISKSPERFKIEGSKLVGVAPHTVNFSYDVSGVSDSVFFNPDTFRTTKKELLIKDKFFFTQWYQWPHYYKSRFYTKTKGLHNIGITVKSHGWISLLQKSNYKDQQSDFFLVQDIDSLDGSLSVPQSELSRLGVGENERFWVEHRNVGDFDISGDNFVFETRLKSNFNKSEYPCLDSEIEIACEKNKQRFVFLQPGCSRFAKIEIGGEFFDGIHYDLSALTAVELTSWRTIKVKIKDRICRIYMDDKIIYEAPYKFTHGKVKEVLFRFLRGGMVDYVKMYRENGKEAFVENF